MATIVLNNKAIVPSVDGLGDILGSKYIYWKKINEFLCSIGEIDQIWHFYGKKNGWLLKNELNKRNLFFLVPGNNEFSLSFTFGDKAVKEIEQSNLPDKIVEAVKEAKKYAEGRVLQIEVSNPSTVAAVCKLINIKVLN